MHPLKQDNCMSGKYIGNFAVGNEFGYVVTHTFLPACGGGGTGNADELLPSSVIKFDKHTGERRSTVGPAGMTKEGGGPRPRVAARGTDVEWTYTDPGGTAITIASESNTIVGSAGSQPTVVSSLIFEDTRTFAASWSGPMGPSNALSPRYPCCGGSSNNPPPSTLFSFTNASPAVVTGLGLTPSLVIDQLKEPMVASSSSLLFFQLTPSGTALVQYPKTGGTATTQIATFGPSAYPAGLAVDETHIIYATSVDFRQFGNGGNPPDECTISSRDPAAPTSSERRLFGTTRFTCLDLAFDGTHVYFTIVELVRGDGESSLHSRGIGRVNVNTAELETLELGISGPEAAPRQVYLDGPDLILVAPYIIARIPKGALEGKHDITP